jgi:hypothetical protein
MDNNRPDYEGFSIKTSPEIKKRIKDSYIEHGGSHYKDKPNSDDTKVKSNRGRKKKVKTNDDINKKMIGLYVDKSLYDCLTAIKNNNKISINYICIESIKSYIQNLYPDIYYKLYDNKDKILLNITNDIINDYKNKVIKDSDDTVEASIIKLVVDKVLGIDNNVGKKYITIEKDKLADMINDFIENKAAINNTEKEVK